MLYFDSVSNDKTVIFTESLEFDDWSELGVFSSGWDIESVMDMQFESSFESCRIQGDFASVLAKWTIWPEKWSAFLFEAVFGRQGSIGHLFSRITL